MDRWTRYWKSLFETVTSLAAGLRITFAHLLEARKKVAARNIQAAHYFDHQHGIATIQYPHESIPVPDNGRYRLHNEIDDCIVCDKCAKICPVNCITIEPIRATEEIGKTSDGTSKRIYAATFDINMAQCCFCGLCTTVCPTECLTMTKVYDFSVSNIEEHHYAFAEMTPSEIAEAKEKLDAFQKEKANAAKSVATSTAPEAPKSPAAPRPVFKPRIKPPGSTENG